MRLISLLLLIPFVYSCKKDKPEPVPIEITLSSGMVVLCEGLFQQNNATLSWINTGTGDISNELFEEKAGRYLGDTGNDLKKYGGKVYIVVTLSSTIEVMDATTFAPVKQIEMLNGAVAKQPRSIAFYGSKAYVTCYDGFVDVIDTTSLSVVQRIPVGANPEGLDIANNKLYVANSGGLNTPQMDSTVSVIDLDSHIELQKITVGLNPGSVISDSYGDVYVIARGDYGAISSRLVRIDSQNDSVADEFLFEVSGISSMNEQFLTYHYNYSNGLGVVSLFDPSSETILNSNYINTSEVNTLYGVQYNPLTNKIYAMDAMNFTNTGYIHEYDINGNKITSYHVGLNPSKILFYE